MKTIFQKATSFVSLPLSLLIASSLLIFQSCKKNDTDLAGKEPKMLKDFIQVNLVGNNTEYNPRRVDPLLVNAWGIALSSFGTVWISAEGTGVSTVYDSVGNDVLPHVSIPSPASPAGGHPTGQVFNSGNGFKLSNGNPARFIFAGADGVISAWNGGPSAERMINDPGDAYLGITIANNGANKYLYVANFSDNEIEVYDTSWNEVSMDFHDPNIPTGYAPFNIQNVDGQLFVMYAKVGADGEEEKGPGNGYVDIYNPDGSLMKRFVTKGQLNAPWGVAKAPASFWGSGGQSGNILIGNFGDGRINAYSSNGDFIGQLRLSGVPIEIEGLWGITFPPASAAGINPNWLYFAAGPDDEEEGLFGYITKPD